jgi:glycosyltransferase involved in cell wall biosynthesis
LQLRGSRTDFVKQYDITPKDLELNTAVLESFALHRAVNPRRIVWFVPPFDNPYRGGIHTILRLADAFTRHAGSRSEIVVYERFDGLMEFADADRVKAQVTEAFPTLNFDLHHLRTASEVAGLGTSDIAFATLWTGAYHLLRYNQTVGKFYLVQDYEPAFQGANSVGALAEQTYRFGFDGIANTPGVASHYRSYGNHTTVLFPGVDHLLFRPPRTPRNPEEPLSIVFYGRPQRERNGFELGIEALRRVKEQFGKNVVIRSVGAKYDLAKFGLEDVLANLGVLPDLQSVARLYRQSDIGLVFMFTAHPSYQPLEYMASGCVTVTNINESNAWLLRDNENALVVPPSPAMVAGAISELIGDADLRRRLAAAGIDTVQEFYWEPQLERAVQWVVSGARE